MLTYYTIFLIFISWLAILPSSIFFISEKIWILGVYHTLATEEFDIKLKKVFLANAYLSFPFILSFYIVIKNTVPSFDSTHAFILSLVISLVSVISLRVLANPSNFIKPTICKYFQPQKENELIAQHKERILSFFYSFVCAALIILFIIFSTNIFSEGMLSFTSVGYQSILIAIISYSAVLIILTYIGECILFRYSPIDQIECFHHRVPSS